MLLGFGLLQCAASFNDDTKVFYAVLQEGGVEDHKAIYSNDKDFDKNFPVFCRLATTGIIDYYNKYGGGKPKYTPEEIAAIESTFKKI
jgi:hypothetical protein